MEQSGNNDSSPLLEMEFSTEECVQLPLTQASKCWAGDLSL